MDAYVQEVCKMENKFSGLEVHHMIREHNIGADILSKLGCTCAQVLAGVFVQKLKQPSIKSGGYDARGGLERNLHRLHPGPKTTSGDERKKRSGSSCHAQNELYLHGVRLGVLMKCITGEDGFDILREIHEGVCGNHAASRTLVRKAYRASFWWPTVVSDAEDLVRRCQNC
jgi:hypothetical protein